MSEHYVRKDTKKIIENYEQTQIACNAIVVEEYPQATIFPLTRNLGYSYCGVADETGELITNSVQSNNQSLNPNRNLEEIKESEKTVVYCGICFGHYGHFLIDTVPRLWYVLENNEEVDEYVIAVEENTGIPAWINGNIGEFLSLLGILDKVKFLDKPTRYKKVYVPQNSYSRERLDSYTKDNKFYSIKLLEVYDYVIDNALRQSENKEKWRGKDIFLTRTNFAYTRDFGIEILNNFYEKNGYVLINPEDISLSDLICILNECHRVATICGTIQHNLLFAKRPLFCTILLRNPWIVSVEMDICQMRGHQFTYVDACECLYPVRGGGPYIYRYNEYIASYAKLHGYNTPDEEFCTDTYHNNVIHRFRKSYSMPPEDYWKSDIFRTRMEATYTAIRDSENPVFANFNEFMDYERAKEIIEKTKQI